MVIDCADIPILGDPMEMTGTGARQFLLERRSPHAGPDVSVAYATERRLFPLVIWVRGPAERPFSFGNGTAMIDCAHYQVAVETLHHWKDHHGRAPWVCECQGRFVE